MCNELYIYAEEGSTPSVLEINGVNRPVLIFIIIL